MEDLTAGSVRTLIGWKVESSTIIVLHASRHSEQEKAMQVF